MPETEILCSCMVQTAASTAGNSGDAAAISRMELAPWDLYSLSICYIQEGLVFRNPISDEFKKILDVDHLKTSLSRTLGFFPSLAGRLGATENDDGTSSFFVDCNNAGAEFTHAIAPGVSVSDILDPIYVPEILYSFFPMNKICNVEGVSRPLLGVQVTELENGFFIGCSANHVVVDGDSFWHFLNSWSEISRGSETISKVPVFQRWIPESIKLPIRFPPFERRNMFSDFDSAPLLQRVFHFSKQNIAKLKSRANSEAGTEKISSLQSLLAHVWRSVLRGRRSSSSTNRNPENQEIYFYMPLGTRERIPDLQNSYFGNAIYAARFATTEDDILHHGLGYTAMKLHEMVAQQTMEQPIKTMEHWAANPTMPPSVGRNSNVCITSSSPRFDVYGNDFGWGKPIAERSGIGSKFDGRIKVFPAADSDGINVAAYLTKETLEAMAKDAEFMEAVTF